MAASWNVDNTDYGSNFGQNEEDQLRKLLRREKSQTAFLKEELHSSKKSRECDKRQIRKLRDENASLIEQMERLNSSDASKDLELKAQEDLLQNYEHSNQNVPNENNAVVKNELASKGFEETIVFYKHKFAALYKETMDQKRKISSLNSLFTKAKGEKFRHDSTLFQIHLLLSNTKGPDMKKEPGQNAFIQEPNVESHLKPFHDYKRPMKKQEVNMAYLNKYIIGFLDTNDFEMKSRFCKSAMNTFNTTQSSCFLYPFPLQFVLADERLKAKPTDESPTLIEENIEGEPLAVMTVEEHLGGVLEEFEKCMNNLPEIFMIIFREKHVEGMKHIMFVFHFESRMLLRYDPFNEAIESKKYRRVYGDITTPFKFNFWPIKHLTNDNKDNPSWEYCIEFARRLAMKTEQTGSAWVKENLMEGSCGNASEFENITFH